MAKGFVPITGFERYHIKNDGQVYSAISKAIKKPVIDGKGYNRIQLYIDGRPYTKKVHRLVAQHFIPNPDNKPQVNHIDGDKNNNHFTNLEWATNYENALHAMDNGLFFHRKDMKALGGKFKTLIALGYSVSDLANKYKSSTTTINKYADLAEYDLDIDLAAETEGIRQSKYYYYDGSRCKYRTELPNYDTNKQFDTEKEAKEYVRKSLWDNILWDSKS